MHYASTGEHQVARLIIIIGYYMISAVKMQTVYEAISFTKRFKAGNGIAVHNRDIRNVHTIDAMFPDVNVK